MPRYKSLVSMNQAKWKVEILMDPMGSRFFWHAETEDPCGIPHLETDQDYAESASACRSWHKFAATNQISNYKITKKELQMVGC